MTSPEQHAPRDEPERPPRPMPGDLRWPAKEGWVQRRRRKVIDEVARNRRGEYRIPTWVLGTVLGVVVLAWVAVILFA